MKKLLRNQDGAVILLIALGMSIFIGFISLVLDMGSLYLEKNRLQKIVDASALAGAQELPVNVTKSEQEALKSIQLNHGDPNLFTISVNEDFTMMEVSGSKKATLFFAKAIGITEPFIQAKAKVELQPLLSGKGAIPLGIQPSTNITFGDLQTLKVSDSASGNFGAVALTGPGAKDYETDLKSGYQFELKVNTMLDTQTGQLAGPTKRAIEQRLSQCPNVTYTDYFSDCARVVLLPVFEPIQTDLNQIKQVKVVGFASFFLEAVSSTSDGAEVIGRFIRMTHSGESSVNQTNYGTYGFKLTQ